MRTTPRIDSLALRPPHNLLEQEAEVLKLLKLVEARPFVFLKGSPFSGRSTLLRQIFTKAFDYRAVYIEFRRRVSEIEALREIERAIRGGEAYPQKTIRFFIEQLSRSFATDSCLLVMIDNLDFVEKAGELVRTLLDYRGTAKFIASAASIPSIDDQFLGSISHYEFPGLKKSEVRNILKNSLSDSESAEDLVIDEITEKTRGNLFVAKSMIAPSVVDGSELSLLDIDRAYHRAQGVYLKSLWERLSREDQKILLIALVVEFDETLRVSLVKQISMEGRGLLIGSSVINRRAQFLLGSREIVLEEFASELFQARSELVDRLDRDVEESRVVELYIQNQFLGRRQECLRRSTLAFRILFESGKLRELIRWSEVFFKELPPEAFDFRRAALGDLGLHSKAIEECQLRLKNSSDQEWRLASLLSLGRALRSSYEFAESCEVLETFLSEISETDFRRIKALTSIAQSKARLGDYSKSLTYLERAREEIIRLNCDHSTTLGDYHYAHGIRLCLIGDYEGSAHSFNHAKKYYWRGKNVSNALGSEYNALTLQFDLGHFDHVRLHLDRILLKTEDYFLTPCVFALHDIRVQIYGYQGETLRALKYWDQHLSDFPERVSSGAADPWYLKSKLLILAVSGKIEEAFQFTRECVFNSAGHFRDRERTFFEQLSLVFQSLLEDDQKESHKILYSLKLDDLKSEDFIFVAAAALNGAYSSQSVLLFERFFEILNRHPQKSSVPESVALQMKCFQGIFYCLKGSWSEAEGALRSALKRAKMARYPLWQIRCHLWLGIIELSRADAEAAKLEWESAQAHISEIDSYWDTELISVLVGYARFLVNGVDDFSNVTLSDDSSYFLSKLIPHYRFKAVGSFKDRQRFSDSLHQVLHSIRSSSHSIQDILTHSGVEAFERSKFSRQDYDLVVNEISKEVHFGRKTLSTRGRPILEKLLLCLLRKYDSEISREELVSRIWGETYNPRVHDTRIYTNISRLRTLLKIFVSKEIIQSSEGGYSLPRDLKFAVISKEQ